jgi:hypothetical protein
MAKQQARHLCAAQPNEQACVARRTGGWRVLYEEAIKTRLVRAKA